jgi:hypothetical protein
MEHFKTNQLDSRPKTVISTEKLGLTYTNHENPRYAASSASKDPYSIETAFLALIGS